MLMGRRDDLAEFERLVAGLADGVGFSVVLQGAAGIGKTAVLDAVAAGCAGDVRVLRAAGTQHESELVFAGLGELLGPVLGRLGDLPPRQGAILRSALALDDVMSHSDIEVFVAATSLLSGVAAVAPVLCLVDDAHWMDASSVDALLFAAKRLRASVGFVFATREDLVSRLDTTTIPRRTLRPLDRAAARSVVLAANPTLAEPAVDDVVESAEGYPLALVEFARTVSWPGARLPEPAPHPVSARIERIFSEHATALPPAARTALIVVAASDNGRVDVVAGAVARLVDADSALDAALGAGLDSGLVRKDADSFVFRHPLARAAVYQSASEAERRAAHRALAEVLAAAEPELAAWHRALSCVGPDEQVAAALEDTAQSARRRGGRLAESRALALAARLSPDAETGTRRLLAAGGAALQAGRHALARGLLTEAVARSADACVTADAQHLLAQIAFWQDGHVPQNLLAAADQVEAVDQERAARLLSFALVPMISDCRVAEALPIARRAWALIKHGVRPFDVAFRVAHVLVMAGEPDAAALTEEAATAAERARDLPAMIMISQPLWWLEDYGRARRFLDVAVDTARASDSLWMLCHALINHAELGRRTGCLGWSRTAAADAIALAEDLGDPMQHAEALAQLAATEALAGDSAEARDHAGESLRIVDSRSAGATELRLTVGHALARTALDAGRPSEAVATLQPLVDKVIADGLRDPAVLPCVSDLLDAYFALDRRADAADLEAWLAETARLRGRRWALLAAARAAALRSPQSELQNLRRALDDDCGSTLLLTARAWLTYGELVRRSGERRIARDALLRADRAFRQAGARAWYARVAAELRACGEPTTPTPDASGGNPLDLLTPQELRVARLAGAGARNREIAQTLSLSEKTVETHLAAAFRKLGIRSRTELAGRMPGHPDR